MKHRPSRRFPTLALRGAVLLVALLVAVGLSLASPGAAPAAHGPTHGPDSFGYTAFSIPFSFEDISSTGTKVLANDDDAFVPAAIGFPFSFYGVSQTSAFLSSNALITFVAGSVDFVNTDLTTTGPVPDVPTIAVLWDDWDTFDVCDADAVYYQTLGASPNRRFVVQWHLIEQRIASCPAIGIGSFVTFQAVLYEGSNAIEYRYLDTDTGDAPVGTRFGGSATVGIRDTVGHLNGRNLQWSHNQAVIGNQTAIRFTLEPSCPPNDDEDRDGLTDHNESLFSTLLGNSDSDLDGIADGNDDANGNGEDDEDEDDDDECPDEDSDDDGEDDEDEDDDEDDD